VLWPSGSVLGVDKLYRRVPGGELPIHFFSDAFAVGCIVQTQRTAKNRTADISVSGIIIINNNNNDTTIYKAP